MREREGIFVDVCVNVAVDVPVEVTECVVGVVVGDTDRGDGVGVVLPLKRWLRVGVGEPGVSV